VAAPPPSQKTTTDLALVRSSADNVYAVVAQAQAAANDAFAPFVTALPTGVQGGRILLNRFHNGFVLTRDDGGQKISDHFTRCPFFFTSVCFFLANLPWEIFIPAISFPPGDMASRPGFDQSVRRKLPGERYPNLSRDGDPPTMDHLFGPQLRPPKGGLLFGPQFLCLGK